MKVHWWWYRWYGDNHDNDDSDDDVDDEGDSDDVDDDDDDDDVDDDDGDDIDDDNDDNDDGTSGNDDNAINDNNELIILTLFIITLLLSWSRNITPDAYWPGSGKVNPRLFSLKGNIWKIFTTKFQKSTSSNQQIKH